jgi:steroid 5-alpha reductase family enzyme
MHDLFSLIGQILIIMVAFSFVSFGISRLFGGRNDFADVAWGWGFISIAAASILLATAPVSLWHCLIFCLVSLWGMRLSFHILNRFRRSSGDKRYADIANTWASHVVLRSYCNIFLTQALITVVISLPVMIIMLNPLQLNGWLIVGLLVWLQGFIWEAVGDHQLRQFLANPANKGKLLTTGLWKYSRHPNYYGEISQWWGLAIIALAAPFGWFGLLGAVMITLLITKISGVPLLEASQQKNPAWKEYAAHTSVLVPFLHRR